MKFGQQLKTSLISDYYYYYIAYDDLKQELKAGLLTNPKWSDELEQKFVASLEAELDKVYTFQKVKSAEINRRIKEAEKEVDTVISMVNSNQSVSESDFELLEEELSDIIANVHDLAKYTRLNYTGFQKIIKKHDKQTGWILKPIFSARLNAKPFFKENYDGIVVKLSKLYDLVRTRGNPIKGDSAAGGSQQNFVRQTTKYWVHPDNITELKLIILKHLPVLVFNTNKEFEPEDSAITSIYYDNKNLDLYKGRLRKDEGAEAIRLRWYGGMSSDLIFVERKTHREDWTGEKSVKARFPLKEKYVNAFMKGEYTVSQAFEKMRKDGKKSKQEIESLEALATEVQYSVITRKLRPCVRSFYNRTAFQLPGDARVRISLDTELTMVREDNFDGVDRTGGNWRRMDIGVDWPFSQLPEKDVCRFPYAVLEVKLQTQMGQEPPQWVRELVSSHLVEAVPKFSKFIHGVATLLPDMVDLIPFWLPQMDVDIRKPANKNYGIERVHHSDTPLLEGNDVGATGNALDSEELAGQSGYGATDGSRTVRFSNEAPLIEDGSLGDENDGAEPVEIDGTYLESSSSAARKNLSLKVNVILNNLYDKIDSVGTWIANKLHDDREFNVPSGTVYESRFRAPKGKKIFVPVRVEPKVYFATERTFLTWLSIAVMLSGGAIALLNYGDNVSLLTAIGFFLTSLLTIGYAVVLYVWRVIMIRKKRAARYDDRVGPTAICVVLALSMLASFIFSYFDKK